MFNIKQEWQMKRGMNNELRKRGFKKLGSTGVRGRALFFLTLTETGLF